MKTDLYNKVTDQIVSALEQGVRPWMQPWSAEHAAGRITRPLRANGLAYQGINVLVLWSEAVTKGYSAPIWMTFRQALELNAHVRKGERGSCRRLRSSRIGGWPAIAHKWRALVRESGCDGVRVSWRRIRPIRSIQASVELCWRPEKQLYQPLRSASLAESPIEYTYRKFR